jgi:hypothetical protein
MALMGLFMADFKYCDILAGLAFFTTLEGMFITDNF